MKYRILILLFFISSKSFSQDSTFYNHVISQLDLDDSKVKSDLMVVKVRPDNPRETIMVIPEIVEEDEDYFELNSNILIVESETGKILHKFFERSSWFSDAIMLSEIEIDTAPYNISENNRVFGIRVHHRSMSQPNPYSCSTISLFMKSKDKLKRILNEYYVEEFGGEWDTRCAGEFVYNQKTLIMKTNKTNGYYDILIKNKVTETKSYELADGECDSDEEISILKTVLKFNGEEYTEKGAFRQLDVYLNDPDKSATNIRLEPGGKIIQKLDEGEDYFTLTITEASNGWFKLVNVMGVEGNNIEIPETGGWIHHSVLGVSTSRKVELLDAPLDGLVAGTIDRETAVRIKDKYLDWVQIEYEGLTGWVESKWLCGNPVTTCP